MDVPVSVFGTHRSCTSLLQYLLRVNFFADTTGYSKIRWKHGRYPEEEIREGVRAVFCFKNPYAWLVDIYTHLNIDNIDKDGNLLAQFMGLKPGPFSKMIRQKTLYYDNPVVRWSESNRQYLDACRCMKWGSTVHFEHMLSASQQTETLRDLMVVCDLAPQGDKLTTEHRVVSANGKIARTAFNVQYYYDKTFMDLFTQEDLNYVNSFLDSSVMLELSYKVIRELKNGIQRNNVRQKAN